jgi:dolichol-phosphate mannosyltransferase
VEYLFVDDGSTDQTYQTILNAGNTARKVSVVKLSRNFGKEGAIAAGLDCCDADAAIIIDGDLQHPPHLIPALISEWEKGANIVDGVKVSRSKESLVHRCMSGWFNGAFSLLTGMDFAGSSDYKLIDRRAIAILNSIEEKNRFFRGLTHWIGLRHSRIELKVEERRFGKSKWSWLQLGRLSIDAITSYSSKPLHIVTVLGVGTLIFSGLLGLQTLYNKFFGKAVSGFTTVILVLLILCSLIMISMGIVGIYLSKIYIEVKKRPLYIIDKIGVSEALGKSENESRRWM